MPLPVPIVIDSSEQAPWVFPGEPCVRRSLYTGDYSLEGYEDRICVERKSLDDLVSSVVGDWRRFAKVCRRMSAFDVSAIICEAPVSSLVAKKYFGETNPHSVRGRVNKIFLDFGVPTYFLDNREICQEWVVNLFQLYLERR